MQGHGAETHTRVHPGATEPAKKVCFSMASGGFSHPQAGGCMRKSHQGSTPAKKTLCQNCSDNQTKVLTTLQISQYRSIGENIIHTHKHLVGTEVASVKA